MIRSTQLLSIIITLFLSSCGSIKVLNKEDLSDLYSEKFLAEVEVIKKIYREGDSKTAIIKLNQFPNEQLLPSEKALKHNLLGVIYFSLEDFEKAIINFDIASTTSSLDPGLNAQINLNLASSYYKLGILEKSSASLRLVEEEALVAAEKKKYYQLYYIVTSQTGKNLKSLESLFHYLADVKSLNELKGLSLFNNLKSEFFQLSQNEKVRLLEEFADQKNLPAAYLSYLEAERLYYSGQKNEAIDYIEWTKKTFDRNEEVVKIAETFLFRLENFSKIDTNSIGIILPLTSEDAKFAKRALNGIDYALRKWAAENNILNPPKLLIRDSQGSPILGARHVKNLVEKHSVAAVIGGLLPDEAITQYKQAKELGALFISLRPVYLNRESKNHLLIEIPGSVESQVAALLDEQFISTMGKKVGILYPNNLDGNTYVNEFWKQQEDQKINVSRVHSYNGKANDFTGPVQNFLNLKYPRERQEELEFMAEIYKLEDGGRHRRRQSLEPFSDFDWIFIPGTPLETVQIIPSFSYYDASKVEFVGIPSWRSTILSRESRKLGRVHFVGESFKSISDAFKQDYFERYGNYPRKVELISFDSMNILLSVIGGKTFSSRNDLEVALRSKNSLEGLSGDWILKENLWYKDMKPLSIRNGKVTSFKYKASEESSDQEASGDLNTEAQQD